MHTAHRAVNPDDTSPRDSEPSGRHFVFSSLAILLVTCVVYGFLCDTSRMPYSPHSDAITYHLASKAVLYRSYREDGTLPFWRGDQFAGFPALTNPQSLHTHPLHVLFLLLTPERALGVTLWLHFLLTGFAYYVLGRALRIGPLACLLMGLAGLLNFKFLIAAYAGWLPTLTVSVLLPLVFASVLQLLRSPRLGASLAVGLTVGLCIQTGSVQLLYYSFWFLALYAALTALTALRRGDPAHCRALATKALLAAATAAGLSAYVWLPIVADLPLLSRSGSSYDFFLFDHSLSPRHLLTFLWPEALGTPLDGTYPGDELWEDVAYFGLIPLLLAVVGAVFGGRRPPTRFLLVSFAVSTFFTVDTPVLRFSYDFLPGFSLFRCPSRFLFLTAVFGICLAGIGLHELNTRLTPRWGPGPRGAVALALLALMTLEGAAYSRKYLQMVEPTDAGLRPGFTRSFLPDQEPYRVAPLSRQVLNYGFAAPLGLQLITGYDPINLHHYQLYLDLLRANEPGPEVPRVWADLTRISRWDLLHALNVRYLVSAEAIRDPHRVLEPVKVWPAQPMFVFYDGPRIGTVHVYRNTQARPRAYFAKRVIQAQSLPDAVRQMKASDLRRTTIIQLPGADAELPQPSSSGTVQILTATDGHLVLQTYAPEPRLLVIGEVRHPGWRGFIDGQEHPIIRTNIALMGMRTPARAHRVTLVFTPPLLAIGFWATCCFTSFAVALLAIRGSRTMSRPAGAVDPTHCGPATSAREADRPSP